MFTIPALDMSKPSEPGFISKTSVPAVPSDVLFAESSCAAPPNGTSSSALLPVHETHTVSLVSPSHHHTDYHTSPLRHTSYPHSSTWHLPVIYTSILSCSDTSLLPIYHPSIPPSIRYLGWSLSYPLTTVLFDTLVSKTSYWLMNIISLFFYNQSANIPQINELTQTKKNKTFQLIMELQWTGQRNDVNFICLEGEEINDNQVMR